MSVKVAFFDVDGVLSVPRYRHPDGSIKPGGTDDWWLDFNIKHADTYKDCKAPNCMKSAIALLRESNTKIMVLTEEHLSFTLNNKAKWVFENYGIPFEDIIWVDNKDAKIDIIKRYCKIHDIPLDECLFVDDTFPIVIKASIEGIHSMHISEFLK
jgi:FMN phosphatase YigB (HAD superfamily)